MALNDVSFARQLRPEVVIDHFCIFEYSLYCIIYKQFGFST